MKETDKLHHLDLSARYLIPEHLLNDECVVFERIETSDEQSFIAVIGMPWEASYEFLIVCDDAVQKVSDAGYGCSFAALYDGIQYLDEWGEFKGRKMKGHK